MNIRQKRRKKNKCEIIGNHTHIIMQDFSFVLAISKQLFNGNRKARPYFVSSLVLMYVFNNLMTFDSKIYQPVHIPDMRVQFTAEQVISCFL